MNNELRCSFTVPPHDLKLFLDVWYTHRDRENNGGGIKVKYDDDAKFEAKRQVGQTNVAIKFSQTFILTEFCHMVEFLNIKVTTNGYALEFCCAASLCSSHWYVHICAFTNNVKILCNDICKHQNGLFFFNTHTHTHHAYSYFLY